MEVATFHCRYGQMEALSAELFELGTLGIQETELPGGVYELAAYFDAQFDAAALSGFVGWHTNNPTWEQAWQDTWHPIEVGQKLWLAPSWTTDPTPPGRLRVDIHPGQGSGTGYSEPTLLMLETAERVIQSIQPTDAIADIGTGSGILLAAAKALGANTLFGCDADVDAAIEARAHTAAAIWCGSPRSMATASVSLVLANMNAITLGLLANDLKRILKPGGRLLIGGFTERSILQLEKTFGKPAETRSRGIWRLLSYTTS